MEIGKRHEDPRIAAQANDWLWKLNTTNPAERKAFVDWLLASPRHVEAILLSTAFHQELHDNLRALPIRAAKHPRRTRRIVISLASATCLLGLAAWAAIQMNAHSVAAQPIS